MAIFGPFRSHSANQLPRKQRGFTLIEILVSFVIFAFGMLGAAGLQMYSLKSAKQSSNMGVAASLIRDYSDMMMATPMSVMYSNTATIASVSTPFLIADARAADIKDLDNSPITTCLAAGCTSKDFLDGAIRDWLKRAHAALPDVRVTVCVDSSPVSDEGRYRWACDNTGKLVVLKMRWFVPKNQAETGEAQSASLTDTSDPRQTDPLTVVTVAGVADDYFYKN